MEQPAALHEEHPQVGGRHPPRTRHGGVQVHQVPGNLCPSLFPSSSSSFCFVYVSPPPPLALYCTPQAGVKLGQHQVELLKKVVKVLDPFYRATLQLSNDAACISEVS